MLKRICTLFLTCFVVLSLYTGCSNTPEPTTPTLPTLPITNSSVQSIAEGFDILGGSWIVGGFYYEQYSKQHLIDISDNDALKDIYDSTYLTFYDGGTFVYMNMYNHRGKYIQQDDGSFILKTETVFTYDFTEEGLAEMILEDSEKPSYIVSVLDDNTLLWNILDPNTGKAKIDSSPLVFEREDVESEYIKDNKTALNNSSGDNSSSKKEETAEKPSTDYSTSQTQSNSNKNNEKTTTTAGMRNALQSAKNYLSIMPFSYNGLIEQLEFEGYSNKEATYAADNCGADWYEQAARCAKNYLDIMSFSRSGLIEQLEFDGYTYEQAVYGVDKVY